MNITQAIEAFGTYQKAMSRSPLTIEAYRNDIRKLAAHCGPIEVETLTAGMVHEWLASAGVQNHASGVKHCDATVNRAKAAVRAFGSWAADTGLIERNPAARVEAKRSVRKSPSALTDEERKRLVRAVGNQKGWVAERDAVILDLFLGTGIRLAELVGLDVKDVDLDGKRILVHAKGGHDEERFIATDLRTTLRKWMRVRARMVEQDCHALFPNSKGKRLGARGLEDRFDLWLRWAGLERADLTVHSLRHTFGTRLYEKTHDLLLVGKAMGHRTLEATKVYVHQDEAAMEDALESL